jgi:AcrR family transcriptional regulator
MNRFDKYNLKYDESSLKRLVRIKILNAAFKCTVKCGFKESNLEKILIEANINKRTLYNYYHHLDYLYEDVMFLTMNTFYNFEYFNIKNFKDLKNIQEFAYQIGLNYVNYSFKNKDLVIYMDFFDSHFNYKYPSHRYDMYLDSLLDETINKLKQYDNNKNLLKDYPIEKLINGIKIMLPTLHYSIAKYIRREDRFNKRYSFLTKESIYELVKALALYF